MNYIKTNFEEVIKNIFPDSVTQDITPIENMNDNVHTIRILTKYIDNLPELIKHNLCEEIVHVYKRAEGHYAIHARLWVEASKEVYEAFGLGV